MFISLARVAAAVSVLSLAACMQPAVTDKEIEPTVAKKQTYSYARDIRPILDQKCIACHACYDAPCQLKLTSGEGLLRGATGAAVYDGGRLLDAVPTRLFIDAHGQAEWRQKGFYSVLNDQGGSPDENLANSLLFKMIELGHNNPWPANAAVPADIELGLARKNACAVPDKFAKYAADRPLQGMPLAITGLSEREYNTLRQWVFEGAVVDQQPRPAEPAEQDRIARWEEFFNREGRRNQLVARYLYEHLYPAHLFFEELDTGNFFELVRSRTPPGKPISIIATVRPNDDPGSQLFYRLRKVEGTIVHKTHMPYPLSAARMNRFSELFLAGDWQVAQLPDYSTASAANPVATFDAIPAGSRYRFMLDNAQYFVTTFIRGPVCAGQIATDVIDDRFFVLFQDPEHDLSITDASYREAILPHLALVPQHERLVEMMLNWKQRSRQMNKYLNLRGQYYRELQPGGRSLDDLWYGGGTNGNAALTVFRNFDNAMVTRGLIGADPKTLWVMDYPMLERTYYLLVVNFNVFGSVASQAETRLYFDLIRANGENNFLHFMPPEVRKSLRDSWYVGSEAETKITRSYDVVNDDMPVRIPYRTGDPKGEFVSLVAGRLKSLSGFPDVINRCEQAPCYSAGASPALRAIESNLQGLASKPAADRGMTFVDFMPDVAFLRISDGDPGSALAYTLIRNKAHTNVAFMFDEAKRREPEQDTMTIFTGLLGSYPNFMFNVPLGELEDFTATLHGVTDAGEFERVVDRWGLRRTHPQIWENFQWFVDSMRLAHPLEAGVYDLSRYKKVADLSADETK